MEHLSQPNTVNSRQTLPSETERSSLCLSQVWPRQRDCLTLPGNLCYPVALNPTSISGTVHRTRRNSTRRQQEHLSAASPRSSLTFGRTHTTTTNCCLISLSKESATQESTLGFT